jgi:integral membrane sensor domain MASE1
MKLEPEGQHNRLAAAIKAAVTRDSQRGPRALLVLGAVLSPLGGALILLGWSGAANSTDVWEQIPYMISGGMLGLALVVAGGFCYFGYWQTEMVVALRRQSVTEERMLSSLERVEALLETASAVPDTRSRRLRTKAAS